MKTGAPSRVPSGARPGPEASAPRPGGSLHPLVVLCVNQVKLFTVVRCTQHETSHFNRSQCCSSDPQSLSTLQNWSPVPLNSSLAPSLLNSGSMNLTAQVSHLSGVVCFFVLLCLVYFTKYHVLKAHPCGSIVQSFLPLQGRLAFRSKVQSFLPLQGRLIVRHVDGPHSVHTFIC